MATNLLLIDPSTLANGRAPVDFMAWIKSAGTAVLVNEDNPLPVTFAAGGGSSVTQNSVAVPQSTSGTIPVGAKGWTFTILTGTATFNGAATLPALFSDGDPGILAVAITYSTDSASTAYVRYGS